MLSDIFSNAHSRQKAEKLTEITFEGSCLAIQGILYRPLNNADTCSLAKPELIKVTS